MVHEEGMADGVLAVLKRYLCPNGLAIIVNPHSHHRAGVERFRELLRLEGFDYRVVGIDGSGVEKRSLIDARVASGSILEAEKGDSVRRTATEGMARYEEEMKDVKLELYVIQHRTSVRPSVDRCKQVN